MDSIKIGDPVKGETVNCPLFKKDIAYGLCWDIANVGNDSLMLPPDKIPPCGWDAAHQICDKCPVYLDMGK